jgi:glucose/arabinose dehydrogenase
MRAPSGALGSAGFTESGGEVRKTAAAGVCVVLLAGAAVAGAQTAGRDVAKVFAESCASCHGEQLRGGQAQSLVDDVWKYGGDDESLARSIHDGRPDVGMPPFGAALSREEIRSLVIFIREKVDAARKEASSPAKPKGDAVVLSEEHAFRVETVAEGLDTPWGIAFLPDGRMLVTEKKGSLRVVENGRPGPPVAGIPAVIAEGQGGLLDVAVHPDYARNGWVYLSFSDPGEHGAAMTAVVRGKLQEGRFAEQQLLFRAPAALYRTGGVHFGSRLVFDGEGHLFFSIGERGRKDDAQDLARPNGKVHRIFDDGRVPEDNPFARREGAMATIWSYGHRNPQGLAREPGTGALWDAEHGPRGGDELNRVEAGKNYGWPLITYGMNYDGTPITAKTSADGLEQPATYWTPSIAVSSIDFYAGERFPRWKGNLLVGSLAAEELRRIVIEGGRVARQELLFKGIGRVRDVVCGPDGYVYLALNGPDRVVRLAPAPEAAR